MHMHGAPDQKALATLGNITEFSLDWKLKPGEMGSSTHELAITRHFVFVSGQNMDQIAKFDHQGKLLAHYKMPENSRPHGLLVDPKDRLWVSFENTGEVVLLSHEGKILQRIDVKMYPDSGKKTAINTAPHGIGLDADGETIWFTGKRTSTVGKISPDGTVSHFQLETLASLPIYLSASGKNGMWGTSLLGNCIYNVTADGTVREYPIPTSNSRPIAVIADPMEDGMWFTQETGGKIGKIDATGRISEYPVPLVQKNDLLASLCFDDDMNLWVQAYVDDNNNPKPEGNDYLVKLDKSIRQSIGQSLTGVAYSTHVAPSRKVMMHRIKKDALGNLWFTEMMTDKLGKVTLNKE